MRILIMVMLVFAPVQADAALGWFLLGMAVGGGDKTTTTYNIPTTSDSFIEVEDCSSKNNVMIRSSLVTGFEEQRSKKRILVYTIKDYYGYCIYDQTLDHVKSKFFTKTESKIN